MFRKLTERINSTAHSVMGVELNPSVKTLTQMGFEREAACQALEATNDDVDRAAELLLAQGSSVAAATTPPSHQQQHQQRHHQQQHAVGGDDDATMQRVMQESLQAEERRRAKQERREKQQQKQQQTTGVTNGNNRTAAMNKAAQAAEQRAAAAAARSNPRGRTAAKAKTPPKQRPTTTTPPNRRAKTPPKQQQHSGSGGLSTFHPDVKLIPKLQDKSKEEQILRCADRLKNSPAAVDTLYRALVAVQKDPANDKFRKVDKTTAGYQRSVANAPGAEDLLLAMNYRPHTANTMVLDSSMVDAALLYLGVSALEQVKQSDEYKHGKQKVAFAKAVREIQMSANDSEEEAIRRSEFMSKCPSEPTGGRGALMQVVLAEETIRRRFDGDDTLSDVLNWLGGHGSVIPEKLLSREWSLVDLNRYPVAPMDCESDQHHTLQYIGCWPSGRLEVLPSTEGWQLRASVGDIKRGSSRGLGSAPSEAM